MPKIRGVKPETWTDDKFVQLSPLARLLFIGMWNLACDNGHVEDNTVQLKMRLLPMDACDVVELVDEMVEIGQVERHDGWLKVVNLVEHQKAPDKRFLTLCERCAHDEHAVYMDTDKLPRSTGTRRVPTGHTASTQSAHAGDGDGEGEGDGEVRGSTAGKPARATRMPDRWQPSEAHVALAAERSVDLANEADAFRDWCAANGKTYKDWEAAFRNWVRRARPTQTRPSTPTTRPHVSLIESAPPGMTDEEYDEWEAAQLARRRQA